MKHLKMFKQAMKPFQGKFFIIVVSLFLFARTCTPVPSFAASAPATPQEGQIGQHLTSCVENPAPCLNIPRLVAAWRQAMGMVSSTATNWVSIFDQLIAASPMPKPNAATKATPFYNAPDSAVEVVPTKP